VVLVDVYLLSLALPNGINRVSFPGAWYDNRWA
jgi:hypothetical protein